jgi:hypothetical protein
MGNLEDSASLDNDLATNMKETGDRKCRRKTSGRYNVIQQII